MRGNFASVEVLIRLMNSIAWICIKFLFIGAVLLFGGVLYYNVSTKDTLEFRSKLINLYLEHKLSEFFFGADVSMQDVKLTWRRADENFVLSAQGVTVVDKNLGVKVEAPEASIYSKIGILFLWGDWGDSRLEIEKVSVDFLHSEGVVQTEGVPFSVEALRSKLLVFVRSNIPVKIGKLLLQDDNGGRVFVDSLRFGKENEYDGRVFNLEFSSDESAVRVRLSEHYKGVLSLHVEYDNFNTNLLRYLEFLDARLARYKNFVLSGTADIVLNAHDGIDYGEINLQNLKGVMPYGSGQELVVQSFKVRAKYSDGKLQVINFNLLADDDIALRLRASFDSSTDYLDVNVVGYEISAKNVCAYWPEQMYAGVREWYCNHVLSGYFREPQVFYHGPLSDIANLLNYRVSSHLKDAVVFISDDIGEIKVVDGGLLLSRGDLIIRSGDYSYRGVHALEGKAVIKGISSGAAKLEVQGHSVDGAEKLYEATGVQSLLSIGGSRESISGVATTDFNIEVYNLLGDADVYSKVSIASKVEDLDAEGILNSLHVKNGSMNVNFSGGVLRVDGAGTLNDHDMVLSVTKDWQGDKGLHCKFDGYVSGENLQGLSSTARMLGVNGYAPAEIEWISGSAAENTTIGGKVDITHLSLGGDQKGYFDIGDLHRELSFLVEMGSGGNIDIAYVDVKGDGVDVSVSGKVKDGNIDLVADKIEFLKTNAWARIKSDGSNIDLKLRGEFLDLSKANLGAFLKGESASRDVVVSIESDKALMNNGVLIEKLDIELATGDRGGTNAKVRGYFAGDMMPISIDYGPMGLEVVTGNAGKFLRAIDVLNTVDGGRLSIYMYPDTHSGRTNGMFSITRFNIVGAPILAQILTLSSLKGISNTLSGSGIHFSKLNVPFNYKNNVISFGESWMEGAELGISLDGIIDLVGNDFDIRGQIVPAYAVNKMVWSAPIIGKILTGGYSRGIVAIDYKVKGTAKQHDISVNFLSILTPNLLKRVLKVLDYKMKQESESSASHQHDKVA
ncbi:AsmA-like C-terminal domain-containing protein [Anaplasma phagocytophilum]|uniref:YhdP family protein n=1 Tax=Anaplasma phagocytophilum TaxID=948 RepID=UPI00200BB9C8|nr:AsmA-like C-terminal domain-containing protein [Anaplasma phagocytophilum]